MVDFIELTSQEELRKVYPLVAGLQSQIREPEFVSQCLEDIPNKVRVFAIRDAGELVSAAAVWLLRKSSREGFVWVYFLYTLPEYRSKGFGKLLMENIEVFARSNGFTELRVHSRLTRNDTHRFYEEKLNYSKSYYVFCKELTS